MTKEWNFPVTLNWYSFIDMGKKKYEGRVPDESKPEKDYSKINLGDIAVFSAVTEKYDPIYLDKLKFVINSCERYNSVFEMFKTKGMGDVLPGVDNVNDGIDIYHSFPGYEDRIKEQGIYAIGLGERLK